MGVETPNIASSTTVTELIGNKDGNTVRILADRLAEQLSLGAVAVNKETRVGLFSDLSWASGTRAAVWGDANESYRGIYLKSGDAGAGSWSRIGDLPQSALTASQLAAKADQSALTAETEARQAVEKLGDTIRLTSIGGTGDAVTAAVPSTQAHIDLVVGQTVEWRQPADNTGAVTITIGSNAFELQSLVGAPLVAGALKSGARYRGVVQLLGATNRIRLQQATSTADLVETDLVKLLTADERARLLMLLLSESGTDPLSIMSTEGYKMGGIRQTLRWYFPRGVEIGGATLDATATGGLNLLDISFEPGGNFKILAADGSVLLRAEDLLDIVVMR